MNKLKGYPGVGEFDCYFCTQLAVADSILVIELDGMVAQLAKLEASERRDEQGRHIHGSLLLSVLALGVSNDGWGRQFLFGRWRGPEVRSQATGTGNTQRYKLASSGGWRSPLVQRRWTKS